MRFRPGVPKCLTREISTGQEPYKPGPGHTSHIINNTHYSNLVNEVRIL